MSFQVFAPFEHNLWISIIFGSSFNEAVYFFSCTIFDITHLVVYILCCFPLFPLLCRYYIRCWDLTIFLFCKHCFYFLNLFLMFSTLKFSFYVATPFLPLSATGLPILCVVVFPFSLLISVMFVLLISGSLDKLYTYILFRYPQLVALMLLLIDTSTKLINAKLIGTISYQSLSMDTST